MLYKVGIITWIYKKKSQKIFKKCKDLLLDYRNKITLMAISQDYNSQRR